MVVAYVKKVCEYSAGSPQGVHNLTWTATPAIGNLVVAVGHTGASGTAIAATSSLGNPYAGDVASFGSASAFALSRIVTTGEQDISAGLNVSCTPADYLDFLAVELSAGAGFDASRLRASITNAPGGSSTSYPCGSTNATPTADDVAIAAVGATSENPSISAWTASFLAVANTSGGWMAAAQRDLAAAGVVTTTATGASRSGRWGLIVVYREIGGAAPTGRTRLGIFRP